MVNVVTSAGQNGVHDFILIRASAIILVVYTLMIAGFFVMSPNVTHVVWQSFFANLIVKVATIMAFLALLVHAKIGVWQVLSDYVKPAFIRAGLQFIFSVTLLIYLVFGFLTVWSV
jgi:succinate dehydrogenase / fumarate reductase membrane anchor subunit